MTATTGPTQEQQDTHFMELALRQAEAAVSAGQTPFGAVAVDQRGSVVGQVAFKRVVFAARGTDVPTYKPRLGADLSEAAAWVNTQAGWARLEVVGDFMRSRALQMIEAFPWARAQARTDVDRDKMQ